MKKIEVLRSLTFGQRVAEEEAEDLSRYFVETDQWLRLYNGHVDVIYGPKGAGKSALYSLLQGRATQLFDRKILLVAGENVRGATAFRDVVSDPPANERQFMAIWKLFFCCLLAEKLHEFGIVNDASKTLHKRLSVAGLIAKNSTLSAMLKRVMQLVNVNGIEGEIVIDQNTGLPVGVKGRLELERTKTNLTVEVETIDIEELLGNANDALQESKYKVWITLDRLDVAFAESVELEANALRALFRVYLDLMAYQNIELKIFLRTDIWKRITQTGFREASHITRHMTIDWSQSSLLNLIVKRSLDNSALRDFYSISDGEVKLSTGKQDEFFYRMCPEQVDVGPNKPKTFDWTITRTRDGTQRNAPRELIHFFNSLRDVQIARLENGSSDPEEEKLFLRPAFKDALPDVSKVRLEQTLYAEHPDLKLYVEAMRNEKTLQSQQTLAEIWKVPAAEAFTIAERLAEVGFFEVRGEKQSPEYWVPFIYRDALDLVQGTAE